MQGTRLLQAASAVVVGLSLASANAQTEESSAGNQATESVASLDPLVITPTRTSRTVDSSLSSVKVIDEAELRRQQPAETSELLRAQPGIDVSGNGSFGKATSVYSRGMGSGSTLLMINGVRLRSATTGSPSWQFIPPALIQRMEIVRGPRGSLYGSDAMGGVIQMFTAPREASNGWMQLRSGSFNTQEVAAGFSSENNGTRMHLGFDRFRTGGTEIRENGEDQGYDNTAFVAGLNHTFDNGARLGANGFRASGTTEFIGGHTNYLIQTSAFHGSFFVTDHWRTRLQLSEARDDSKTFQGDSTSIFNTRSRMVNWKNIVRLGQHELVLGADLRRDSIESDSDFSETERDNAAGILQVLLNFGPADVQASARYDDNEAYGHKTTGSLALGYELDRHHRLRASYGTAFRAPTFNDLYFPDSMFFASNENLEPESSATGELGARGQYQQWFWDLAAFQTDAQDLIVTVNQGGTFTPANVNEARIRGVELSSGVETEHWSARLSLTAMDPRNEETDNLLRRRARRSARLDLDRQFNHLRLGTSVIAQSKRYNDAANMRKLDGFALLNLRAGWSFSENWSAKLNVKNVLDKQYATAYNSVNDFAYVNAGRAAYLSIQYGQR